MRVTPSSSETILARMRVPGEANLFVLGCFERPATVYMQQVRALNLVYALSTEPRSINTSLVVVGAGAAGLTAASAAAILGWSVTVLEQNGSNVLSFAGSDANKRWLHPHIYDWPQSSTEEVSTQLGVLDWSAGPANTVVEGLRYRWSDLEVAYGIETHLGISEASVTNLDSSYLVQWNGTGPRIVEAPAEPYRRRRLRAKRADIVILAVGFGREEPAGSFKEVKSYWDSDDIDKGKQGGTQTPVVLVSGTGDGGLIDTLRYSFSGFKHEEVLKQLRDDWLGPDEFSRVKVRLAKIEAEVRAAKDARDPYEARLNWDYRELVDSLNLKKPVSLRQDLTVVLTGNSKFPLTLESAPINRFLFSLTSAQYIPGPLTEVKKVAGDRWLATFRPDQPQQYFDDVVIRHGPASALRSHFPDIYERCRCLLEQAQRGRRDPTRDLCYDATFTAVLKAASTAALATVDSPGVNDVRDSLASVRADAAGNASFDSYRTLLLAEFDNSSSPQYVQEIARIAVRRSLGNVRQSAQRSERTGSLDAAWLSAGAQVRLISGQPGSGKSVLLRFLVGQAAREPLLAPLYVQGRRVRAPSTQPFFMAAIDWCHESLPTANPSQAETWRRLILDRIMQGRVIVFFEGLDELRPEIRLRIVDMINEDDANFKRGNRLVLTGGTDLHERLMKEMEVLEVAPPSLSQLRELLESSESATAAIRESRLAFVNFASVSGVMGQQLLDLVGRGALSQVLHDAYDWMNWWIAEAYRVGPQIRRALAELALVVSLDSRITFSRAEVAQVVGLIGQLDGDDVDVDGILRCPLLVQLDASDDCLSFIHISVQEVLASEALASREDTLSAIAMALDGPLSTSEIVPIALGLIGCGAGCFAVLESMPDSLDFEVLRLRARAARYRARPSTAQSQRLADDVHEIVSNAELASGDVIERVAAACFGIAQPAASIMLTNVAAALKAPDPVVQVSTLRFLERARLPEVTQLVTPLLLSADEVVRKGAAHALGELADPTALPALVRAYLSNQGSMVFTEAIEAIERIGGEKAVTALIEILEDPSLYQNRRWPAAMKLGELGNRRALEPLVAACRDTWEVVRSHAAGAVGRFDDPIAIKALIECLDDSEASVRIAAAEGLITIAGEPEIDRLLRALEDTHPVVRTASARALLSLDPDKLLDALRAAIEREGDTWRSDAVGFLGEVLGPGALPTLLLLAGSPDADVRLGAARALVHQDHDDAVSKLLAMTEDPSENVRYAAVEGLPRRADPAIARALARCLAADEDDAVGFVAAGALGRVGGPLAAGALRQAVERGGPSSWYAALPLAAIGGAEAIPVLAIAWRAYPPGKYSFRELFAKAIGRIDGEEAAATLRLLAAEDAEGRIDIVWAFAEMQHAAAVPVLLLSLGDDSNLVRRVARWVLQDMTVAQLQAGLVLALSDSQPAVQKQAAEICPFYADESIVQALAGMDAAPWGTDGENILNKAKEAAYRRFAMRKARSSPTSAC